MVTLSIRREHNTLAGDRAMMTLTISPMFDSRHNSICDGARKRGQELFRSRSGFRVRRALEADFMRLFVAIILLGMTPALAQGVVNRRDGNGNLVRDKGVSAPTVVPHALVNSSVNQFQQTATPRLTTIKQTRKMGEPP
jgi:hypothetical protein